MQTLVLLAMGVTLTVIVVTAVAVFRLKARTRALQAKLKELHHQRQAAREDRQRIYARFQQALRRWRGQMQGDKNDPYE